MTGSAAAPIRGRSRRRSRRRPRLRLRRSQRPLPRRRRLRRRARSGPVPRRARPVAAADDAREERVKMTRLRQTIARRLKDAQNTAAMLTTFNEVDMKPVMDLRDAATRNCSRKSTA